MEAVLGLSKEALVHPGAQVAIPKRTHSPALLCHSSPIFPRLLLEVAST